MLRVIPGCTWKTICKARYQTHLSHMQALPAVLLLWPNNFKFLKFDYGIFLLQNWSIGECKKILFCLICKRHLMFIILSFCGNNNCNFGNSWHYKQQLCNVVFSHFFHRQREICFIISRNTPSIITRLRDLGVTKILDDSQTGCYRLWHLDLTLPTWETTKTLKKLV